MRWSYVEPCCGSAAVALALLGARRPLLPYQGSKWRFRKSLLARFVQLGFFGRPAHLALHDVGPWGVVAPTVVDPAGRAAVLDQLRLLERLDPRAVYDALHQQVVPVDRATFSAQFLFLQRLAYSGKAVGDGDGRWASPGFNTSSAYGLPGTDRFGKVNPMIPSLIKVLEGYDTLGPGPTVEGARQAAVAPSQPVTQPTLVYLDPPYASSTGYPGGSLGREEVVQLASAWCAAGATVVVSESEALPELVDAGWEGTLLDPGRSDTSRFRGKQQEWITVGVPSPG